MNDDLADLYQDIILGHSKRPRNEEKLEPWDCRAEGFNPLCGDKITVFVRKRADGGIERITFLGEGCAISRASASIMTVQLSGCPAGEIDERIERVVAMLSDSDAESADGDLATMGDLAALAGVRRFPARIKCATLAWHTLRSALRQEERLMLE